MACPRAIAPIAREAPAAVALALMWTGAARAEPPTLHVTGGAAHAVSPPQSDELSWGGAGSLAVELPLASWLGAQATIGGVALVKGDDPPPQFESRGAGLAALAGAGVRFHFRGDHRPSGLWLDGNVALARTGTAFRPAFEAHVGYDFAAGIEERWGVGPFVGYTHLVLPDASVRQGDAQMVSAGLHVAFGGSAHVPAAPPEVAAPSEDDDACFDEAGVRTAGRKSTGCPRPVGDRDTDTVLDDEDACPDVAGLRASDPTVNGCPPSDRDRDTIADGQDACPDVPGPTAESPQANWCPPAQGPVSVTGDRITLDDRILFKMGSPRVRFSSWPLVKKLAEFVIATPDVLEVDIEGHADEVGDGSYNVLLSQMRADRVKRLLVKYGVAKGRLTTHAYGESRPRVPGHAERQHRENRRVEFIITRARKGIPSPEPSTTSPLGDLQP